MKEKKIGSVIVLYNPDLTVLSELISQISMQVDKIVLIDNSHLPQISDELRKDSKIHYSHLGGNKGIAYAQNEGIKYLESQDIDYVIFFDQDSIPPEDLVDKLYSSYKNLLALIPNIGALGARPFNRGENKKYEATVMKGYKINERITEVNEIISSASFVPINNFSDIGYMDESLFIDGVDHEWCWRAKKIKNLRFFIVEDALLSHQVGEGDRYFLFRKISISTPFRTYYQFRNLFILLRKDYTPTYWKISSIVKYSIKLFYYPIFISPRYEYLKNIFKGISDGVKSILKKEDNNHS